MDLPPLQPSLNITDLQPRPTVHRDMPSTLSRPPVAPCFSKGSLPPHPCFARPGLRPLSTRMRCSEFTKDQLTCKMMCSKGPSVSMETGIKRWGRVGKQIRRARWWGESEGTQHTFHHSIRIRVRVRCPPASASSDNPGAVTSLVRALVNGPIRNSILARYLRGLAFRVSSSLPRIKARITSGPLDRPGFGVHGRLGKRLGPLACGMTMCAANSALPCCAPWR